MPQSVLVLGAGMVGVSVAVHLRRRGYHVLLVDRRDPGEGASFGNAGLIQRETVFPHAFPRVTSEILRIAANRSIDVSYHPLALPGLASPLFQYWRNSGPSRYGACVRGHARLILTCLDEHREMAAQSGGTGLLRPTGFMHLYGTQAGFDAALATAEKARRDYDVHFNALDTQGVAEAEPHLLREKVGAIHWTDSYSCGDPQALTLSYAGLFQKLGGRFVQGDATTLHRNGAGWTVQTADGKAEASSAVVALGAFSNQVTGKFGYTPPLFGKRGYHKHYRLTGNAVLNRPVLDRDNGYLLAPMRAGIRLTTGAEFARADAPETPVQLRRAEPMARQLLPLGEPVESTPWMGIRPCTPDMMPIIGRLPGQADLWCAFGHAHQGFTLGPTTGRLVAEMMTGETPFVDPAPYRPDRFWRPRSTRRPDRP